uniref:Uncharacterized protein n=1 Tax=Panagrolaimus sp. ES5 TaxID=591445 RepID=A0AC34F581_9BILA
MQFKASQRLRNPNEENLNVNERINASAVQANCPPTSFNLEGSTVPPQQQEQQQQNPSVLSNMSNPP